MQYLDANTDASMHVRTPFLVCKVQASDGMNWLSDPYLVPSVPTYKISFGAAHVTKHFRWSGDAGLGSLFDPNRLPRSQLMNRSHYKLLSLSLPFVCKGCWCKIFHGALYMQRDQVPRSLLMTTSLAHSPTSPASSPNLVRTEACRQFARTWRGSECRQFSVTLEKTVVSWRPSAMQTTEILAPHQSNS